MIQLDEVGSRLPRRPHGPPCFLRRRGRYGHVRILRRPGRRIPINGSVGHENARPRLLSDLYPRAHGNERVRVPAHIANARNAEGEIQGPEFAPLFAHVYVRVEQTRNQPAPPAVDLAGALGNGAPGTDSDTADVAVLDQKRDVLSGSRSRSVDEGDTPVIARGVS